MIPAKTLTCCVCYGYTRGRQYYNRDRGYGLCQTCASELPAGEADRLAGPIGTHREPLIEATETHQ